MTNHAARFTQVLSSFSSLSSGLVMLALVSGGCDQPQPATATSAETAPPPAPQEPVAPAEPAHDASWIDLPAGRFAQRHDAGAADDAPPTEAAVPEATPSPAPPSCLTLYLDQDGDGFGSTPVVVCDGDEPPAGAAATGGDCCDTDPNVHPGQLAYFPTAAACGSYDYDCDGSEQPEDASCQLGCGVPCLHSFTTAVPPESCR